MLATIETILSEDHRVAGFFECNDLPSFTAQQNNSTQGRSPPPAVMQSKNVAVSVSNTTNTIQQTVGSPGFLCSLMIGVLEEKILLRRRQLVVLSFKFSLQNILLLKQNNLI